MSVVSAIDSYAGLSAHQQLGEKGHCEYSWKERTGGFEGDICKIFFQMVRSKGTKTAAHSVEKEVRSLLNALNTRMAELRTEATAAAVTAATTPTADSGAGESATTSEAHSSAFAERHTILNLLTTLYRLSAHTRDIISGKGERDLAYAMVLIWYDVAPSLAFQLASRFWDEHGERTHPYGSWKDVKYLCEFVKLRTHNEKHPIIKFAVEEIVNQVRRDYDALTDYNKATAAASTPTVASDASTSDTTAQPSISLAARWVPREKSHFSWLNEAVAREMYPHLYATATSDSSMLRANRMARTHLRRLLSSLNAQLDTTQIKMCGRTWREIQFNHVTSSTLAKNRLAFLNQTKHKNQRSHHADRIACAEHLAAHLDAAASGDKTAKVHGKRLSVYELVRDAVNHLHSSRALGSKEAAILNLQWEDNAKMNGALGPIIPMSDTSGSMSCDENRPLFSSIGLGIRVSECAHPAFRNRVLTFSESPSWVNLEKCGSFVEKVDTLRKAPWGGHTNFYDATRLILDALIENDVDPADVRGMTLAVFSDMQIDSATSVKPNSTMFDNIKRMFEEAGMRTKYKVPYDAPHILFWNLRSTSGFPVATTTENVTMMSGFSAALLNAFCDKGVAALREMTPIKMLYDVLGHSRFDALDDIMEKHYE